MPHLNLYIAPDKLVPSKTTLAITSNDESARKKELAMHAIAIGLQMLGYKEKVDFTISTDHELTLIGRCNILHIVNKLLIDTITFTISPHNQVLEQLVKCLISTIGDATILPAEADKLQPLICAYLDAAYNAMAKEVFVVRALAANTANQGTPIAEDYNGNILKHPLFQLYSIIMDYEKSVSQAFTKKGLLGVFSVGNYNEKEKNYKTAFDKYRFYVPSCYLTEDSYHHFHIDADKIRNARPSAVAQSLVPRAKGFQ